MNPEIEYISSPNHSSRRGVDVSGTVIHYTAAGRVSGSIRWFTMPESGASSHFLIGRDGSITRMVSLKRKAWHAGASEMIHLGEMESDANRFTIGIELANCGLLVGGGDGEFFYQSGRRLSRYTGLSPVNAVLRFDNGHEVSGWWEPYPSAQIDALQSLLLYLAQIGYKEAAANPVGHEEIAVPFGVRKIDPGPMFPWDRIGRRSPRRTASVLVS